jgi:hypothetical protein
VASSGLGCLLVMAVTLAAGRSGRRPIFQEALVRRMTAEIGFGSNADPSRTRETGVYGFCEDCRKVYEFSTQSRATLGLAKILEAP